MQWALSGDIALATVDKLCPATPIERDFVDDLLIRLSNAHLDDGPVSAFTVPFTLYSTLILDGSWQGEMLLPRTVTRELMRLARSWPDGRKDSEHRATELLQRLGKNRVPRAAALATRCSVFATRITHGLVHPVVGAQRWTTPMIEYDDDSVPAVAVMCGLPELVTRWRSDAMIRDEVEASIRRLAQAYSW